MRPFAAISSGNQWLTSYNPLQLDISQTTDLMMQQQHKWGGPASKAYAVLLLFQSKMLSKNQVIGKTRTLHTEASRLANWRNEVCQSTRSLWWPCLLSGKILTGEHRRWDEGKWEDLHIKAGSEPSRNHRHVNRKRQQNEKFGKVQTLPHSFVSFPQNAHKTYSECYPEHTT